MKDIVAGLVAGLVCMALVFVIFSLRLYILAYRRSRRERDECETARYAYEAGERPEPLKQCYPKDIRSFITMVRDVPNTIIPSYTVYCRPAFCCGPLPYEVIYVGLMEVKVPRGDIVLFYNSKFSMLHVKQEVFANCYHFDSARYLMEVDKFLADKHNELQHMAKSLTYVDKK